jgi:hypothetical protein
MEAVAGEMYSGDGEKGSLNQELQIWRQKKLFKPILRVGVSPILSF